MQRSGSQKVLLVLSIITIIVAVLGLVASIMAIAGGALFGATDPSEAAEVLDGSGISQGELAAGVGIAGLLVLISCAMALIEGILGVRAANDCTKIMPVWILSLITVVLSFVGAMMYAFKGQLTDDPTRIASLVGNALMFWIANNIKTQGGR